MSKKPPPKPPHNLSANIGEMFKDVASTALNRHIVRMESSNQKLKSQLRQWKFLTVLAFIISFDVVVFQNMQTWGGTISIFVFQILVLIMIARALEVKIVDEVIGWLREIFGGSKERSDKKISKEKTRSTEN